MTSKLQILKNILEPRKEVKTMEFSRMLGVLLVLVFVGYNVSAWYRGNWSLDVFNLTTIYAILAMMLMIPDIELWVIDRSEEDGYRYE